MSFWDDEAFEEGGGGGIAKFTGQVTEAYFSENEYGASLRVVTLFDHPELYPDRENGTYTQFYSLGQNATEWKSPDAGETVVHQDPSKKARKDSDFGRLGQAFRDLDGLREARPEFNPYVAASYKGLHLEWERATYEVNRYRRDDAGQKIPDPNKPDKFLLEPVTKFIMLPASLVGAADSNGAGEIGIHDLGLTGEQVAELTHLAMNTDAAKWMVTVATQHAGNKALMDAVTKDTAGVHAAFAANEPF